MSGLRVPVVVGLARGAGTSTIASALHAREGSDHDTAADVLVCNDLDRAAAVITQPGRMRPLLAVTGADPAPARVRALESRFAAVVALPYVERWAGLAQPSDELATLLGLPFDHLPRPLQAYVSALRQLAGTLVRSGQLTTPGPPALLRPRAVELWRGLTPVERTVPMRPVLLSAPQQVRVVPVPVPGLLPTPAPDAPASPDRAPDGTPDHAPDDGLDDGLDDDALEAACAVAGRAG